MNAKFKIGILAFVILFIGTIYVTVKPYYTFVTRTLDISIWKTFFPGNTVETVDNKINILLLGIAGGDHEGPNLSDSIMVIHYDFETNKLSTIGLPRDVWSSTLKQKINTAYAIGEAKQKNGGLKLAKAEVGGILGIPIEYGVVISFRTFNDLIDYMGGIEVQVEHAFTDKEYPIEGKENDECNGDPEYRCRYKTVTFEKGPTKMDGETALIFVRSRHAIGSEGSDFARSKRQQLVITAIKNNILTILKKRNLNELTGLYEILNKLVERDINNQQLAIITKDIGTAKNFLLKNVTLPADYFEVPSSVDYNGQYVLIPPNNDWDAFHELVYCLLNTSGDACSRN
ncbi:MAG: hypothetical protein RI947_381 [Candidatus Parcubacteria bacterium]|jgi:LCP family protein required for cell wall assembly